MSHLFRIHIFLLCILLLAGAANLYGYDSSNLNERLQAANEQYSKGNYSEAIASYRSMTAEYGFSAEILHNLANSYAADGQYGLAILHYLRGLRLSPGDNDLQGDLEMTRKNIGIFTEDYNFKEKVLYLFDLNQWCLLALAGYVILTFLAIVYYTLKNFRIAPKLSLITAAFICVCLTGAMQQKNLWSGGIIVMPEIRLLMSPFPTASPRGLIEEGAIVVPEKKHGEYIYVSDRRGRSGWIRSEAYRQINTSAITYSQADAGQ